MTSSSSPIVNALALAMMPGLADGPTRLLTVLGTQDSPLDCLAHDDEIGSVREAIEYDFGFLRFLRSRPEVPDSDEMERWAALVRWLMGTVRDWKLSDDPRMTVLAAVLITSRMCGGDTGLWHLLPEDHAPSAEFLATLGSFVSKRQVVFSARGNATPPIWESEFTEAFQSADTDGDWAAIAVMWPRLGHVGRQDILFAEMVRCSARYNFAGLVRATDALRQCHPIMELAQVVPVDQRLRLAIESTSERVRFCCAFMTVARNAEARTLSPDEEAALSELLVGVAGAPEEFRKWMVAFNRYPLRYPPLHRPLGHALAHASQEAATIYIESITLHPIRVTDFDESRTLVSECLRAFSQEASPTFRQAVWVRAYQRWLDWRFGVADPSTHLFDVSRSPIDFAIVSYVYECMSIADRDRSIIEVQKAMSEIELNWRQSESECITEWNRLLSLLQPYTSAYNAIDCMIDNLFDKAIYYPVDISKSLYHRIMFRVPYHSSPMKPK